MRFIKIKARKGTQLSNVIEKLIEIYETPHVRYAVDSIALGFPDVDQTGESNYTKCFNLGSSCCGVHWYESIDNMFFEVTFNGKTLYQIDIIK